MIGNIPPFSLSDFTTGLGHPFRGVSYLFTHGGLKRYAVLPLILNLIMYALALVVFFYFLWRWDIGIVEWDFWGPVGRNLAAAVNWLGWTLKLVVAMAALALSFFTFTGVGMVIASPLNDILSEKVEVSYCGSDDKLDLPFRFTAGAALVSLFDSVSNLIRQLTYTVLALVFLFIPLIGFIPMMLVGAYFSGFGFVDTAMARNYLRPKHKKLIVRKRFWEILGFGLAMQVVFAIPFLGILLLPVGVTSGTLIYCSSDWEKMLAEANMEMPKGFLPPCKREADAAASEKDEPPV